MRTHKHLTALAAAVTLTLGVVPEATAQQRVRETRPAQLSSTVSVFNLAGSVRITAWDRAEITVEGTLGQGVERLEFTSEGSEARIEVVLPERANRRSQQLDSSAELEIRVPAGCTLRVRTITADVSVRDVTGEQSLNTVGGSLDIHGQAGRIAAESIGGDITVEESGNRLRAETVGGKITLRRATGRFETRTISGAIQVTGAGVTDGRMESITGGISYLGELAAAGTLEIESHSGQVEVSVPGSLSARFAVTTFSGSIRNAFGQSSERTSRYGPGRELSFTNGEGAARLTIKTFSGNVEIVKR